MAIAIIDAALIDALVEVIGLVCVGVVNIGSSSDNTAVGCGGSNRACIHQSHERDLTLAGLRTLAVGEVAGGVANTQTIVCGNVAGAEARAAECGLDNATGLKQLFGDARACGGHIDGYRLWVGRHGEVVVADALVLHDSGSSAQVVVSTSRAACDDTLVGHHLAVDHLVNEVNLHLVAEALASVFLDSLENFDGVGLQLVDGEGVAGVERKGNHRLLLAQVDANHCVVVSHLARLEHLEVLRALVDFVVVLNLIVGNPY